MTDHNLSSIKSVIIYFTRNQLGRIRGIYPSDIEEINDDGERIIIRLTNGLGHVFSGNKRQAVIKQLNRYQISINNNLPNN
jgi:hypothetical protein